MISSTEAADVAREYLGADAEIGLDEFDLGYIAWRRVPPPTDATAVPQSSGHPTVVVDKETGELTTWGSQPPSAIRQQYAAHHAARRRFPPEVRAVLERAGWWPGRDKSVAVATWLAEPAVAQALAGIDVAGPARAVLDEFAGLRIPQFGPRGTPDGGFPSQIFPAPGRIVTDSAREFTERTGIPATPIGDHEDGPADLVVDPDGRTFLLHWAGDFLVADSVDGAIIWMVRGGSGDLRPVRDDGGIGPPRSAR
jgi:hypothetical protein